MTLEDVEGEFRSEYSALLGKFVICKLPLDIAPSDGSDLANRPGVYVFWNKKHGVIKVGKSQSNSKKRALEHIRDNTRVSDLEMKTLSNDPDTILILFNLSLTRDMHWVLGLEYYLEKHLSPLIPSGRNG